MARKPSRAKGLGVDQEDYDRMLAEQDGRCAIQSEDYHCGVRAVTRRYHVDHDHKHPKIIRGLLCHVHNRRLWVSATPSELRALADYLERASAGV
jgi:Recombination endonuclease VII